MGGEKVQVLELWAVHQGSPPHGRGKAPMKNLKLFHKRITPAWAGKRQLQHVRNPQPGDHPRMGGEKPVAMHNLTTRAGSPPHGRGKAFGRCGPRTPSRITPAWAGKRWLLVQNPCTHEDHPRMGGEKKRPYAESWSAWGSPPHGRGKVTADRFAVGLDGITPAWAGKRCMEGKTHFYYWDHPRMGGEKTKKIP